MWELPADKHNVSISAPTASCTSWFYGRVIAVCAVFSCVLGVVHNNLYAQNTGGQIFPQRADSNQTKQHDISENGVMGQPKKKQTDDETEAQPDTQLRPLPRGFAKINVRDSRDDVIEKLKNHPLLFDPDTPEVTLLPDTKNQLIRVTGKRFIKQAVFKFDASLLLTGITLILDTDVLDYFTVYTTHETKYGRAQSISPARSQWSDDTITIIVEKPLRVQYLYTPTDEMPPALPNAEKLSQKRLQDRDEFLSMF